MKMVRLGMAGVVGVVALLVGGGAARAGFSVGDYVDEGTVVVGRVALGKIETKAIEKYLADAMPKDATTSVAIGAGMAGADLVLNGMKERGVTEAYFVMDQSDAWPGREPMAVLLPVAEGKDAGEVVKFLMPYADKDVKVEVLGERVVYFGEAAPLKRLRGIHAVARPELALPEDGAAIEVVAGETADARRVIEEMLPRLPEGLPGVGGMSTEWATKGFRNVRVSVEFPPSPSLTVEGNFKTAEDAEAGRAMVKRALEAWMGSPEHAATVASPQGGALKKLEEHVMGELGSALSPPTRVAVRLDSGAIGDVVKSVVPAMDEAKARAQRVEAMNYLRQIALGCILYSQDNKGAWPTSLEDLKRYLKNDALLVDPRDSGHRKFVLQGWTQAQVEELMKRHAAEAPIAYEDPAGEGEGMAVAFMDGHVEWFKEKGEAKKRIEKAEGWVK